jgi:lipopolysaccharide biosynthesis glycosyltransferase
LNPSRELFEGITEFLATSPLVPGFSFPDQDLLAAFFKGKWKPLPWCYNALKTLRVIHKPLWRDEEIRCLHYVLHDKPWHQRVAEGDYAELNEWWWARLDQVKEELIRTGDTESWSLIEANVAN